VLGTALAVAGGVAYLVVLNLVFGRIAARRRLAAAAPRSAPP